MILNVKAEFEELNKLNPTCEEEIKSVLLNKRALDGIITLESIEIVFAKQMSQIFEEGESK